MPLVCQAVPHGHIGMPGQSLHPFLPETAIFDAVIKAGEHARRIGQGFLFAHLRSGDTEAGDIGSLVVGRHLKGATGAGGIFFKQEHNVFALQKSGLPALFFGFFQLIGQIQKPEEFLRRKIRLPQKIPSVQWVHRASRYFPAAAGTSRKKSIMLISSQQ